MKLLPPEAKVGIMVIVAAVSLLYMSFRVGSLPFMNGEEGYSLVIYFDSISGVEPKSYIRLAGVSIGKVKRIILENNRAKVFASIRKGVKIRSDSFATIRAQGLLGEKFVEISGGTSGSPFLKDGDIIARSKKPLDIDEAVGKLGEVLTDIQSVTRSLKNVFGTEEGQRKMQSVLDNVQSVSKDASSLFAENKDKLNKILTNIEKLTYILRQSRNSIANTVKNFETISGEIKDKTPTIVGNLERITSDIREILDNENKENIKQVLVNIKTLSEKLNSNIDEILDKENKENIKLTLSNVKNASAKLDLTLGSINEISDKIKNGEGTIGKLVTDEELYEKLNSTLEGVSNFINKADKLKLYVGFRSEFPSDGSDKRGYFTFKLQPREDKYYLMEVTEDYRKSVSTNNSTLNNLLYTVQFAKRYQDIGLRIGLIESSFGLGADYYLAEDKVRLKLDAFNFGGYDTTVEYAQLKFTTSFKFLKYAYLYGGIDEIFNSKYRALFAGVGITFDDEDLKSIMGMARFAN